MNNGSFDNLNVSARYGLRLNAFQIRHRYSMRPRRRGANVSNNVFPPRGLGRIERRMLPSVTELDDLLAIPAEDWARAALEFVLTREPRPVAHHSIRSYFFARLLAEHEGMRGEVDDRLLFAATALHDIGLRAGVTSQDRFEVDGADHAAEFLRAHAFDEREIDVVWEAIALHTSPGIAERRGVIAMLTREGVGVDFGRNADIVDDEQARRIHDAYPRLSMVTSLVDAIVAQCQEVPAKGPRYTIAGELAHERSVPPHVTQLERVTSTSRWGR
jgi:hypothetical protein